jgi:ElaB/YqjD/DUF883 family membrane-anchored ribosome-binding protein
VLEAAVAERDAMLVELRAANEKLDQDLTDVRQELNTLLARKDAELREKLDALRAQKDAELNKLRAQLEKLSPQVTEVRTQRVGGSPSSSSLWAAKPQAKTTQRETKFLATVPGNVGIIHHLTKRYGNNVHVANRVLVTASSCLDELKYPPKNVADRNEAAFCSNSEPDQWISYDFGTKRIQPTDYCIVSTSAANGMAQNFNLVSWVVEGSSDGVNWLELDAKEGNNDLNVGRATRTWSCVCPDQIRMIRLRQTGKNQTGSDNLTLSLFELFGSLFE